MGDDLGVIGLSPMDVRIEVLGESPDIPMMFYLTLGMKLTLVASAAAMAIYSLATTRAWYGNLLGFGYKKPIWVTLLFVVAVFALTYIGGLLAPIKIPLAGRSVASLDLPPVGGRIEIPIAAGFTATFYLAIAAVVLALVARIYHGRIMARQ